jgi:DNA modification methylase
MTVRIINGDCRDVLKTLPDESVHCVVTSPPYWGLRDYGVAGQIGLEPTFEAFVTEMVGLFGEVRRVLRADGSLWLNLGDCYAGSWGAQRREHAGKHSPNVSALSANQVKAAGIRAANTGSIARTPGLKPKDLVGVPWRVAFALQADGWWLRSANVWAKPNGMPESTRDRPVVAHEHVFQLSRSERYFYDYEAVKLPPVPESVERLARSMRQHLDGPDDPEANGLVVSGGGYAPPGQPPHKGARRSDKQRGHSRRHNGFNDRWDALSVAEQQANGAALRSVWWISPGGFPDAHFAVMPEELASVCILAGCPKGGVVLDPFGGAGTTGLVADRLGRDAILIELNPEYAAMAERRIKNDSALFSDVRREVAEARP